MFTASITGYSCDKRFDLKSRRIGYETCLQVFLEISEAFLVVLGARLLIQIVFIYLQQERE